MINNEALKGNTITYQEDEKWGYRFSSKFLQLDSKINSSPKSEAKPPIGKFLFFIFKNLNDIIIIAKRLDWQKELWMTKKLAEGDWTKFAQLDVDLFFMKIRSIFDYMSLILCRVASHPSKIREKRCKSFRKLRNWVMDENNGMENANKLGQDLAELVRSVDWFDTMRGVRDSIYHEGGFTLVFPEKNRILFQVLKGYKNLIFIPEIMYNENVVDFELLAGLYFGYLIAFLEEFAVLVEKRLAPNIKNRVSSSFSPFKRFPSIFQWIMQVNKI